MASLIKKTGLFIGRGLLAAAALFFVLLIAVQIVLIVGVNIMSTGRGSEAFAKKINESLKETGYQVDFSSLSYDPVRGFTVRDLSVSDAQGVFMNLDRFSLSATLSLDSMRTLDIHARGGILALDRLPESQGPQDDKESQGFAVPDIYFRKIILSNLSFERITLGPSISGTSYSFSPSLDAQVVLDKTIALSFNISPEMPDISSGLPAPEKVAFSGSLNPEDLSLEIAEASVTANPYGISVQGNAALSGNGGLNIAAKAHHNDLSILTEKYFHSFNANMEIQGTIKAPAIDLSALIVPRILKDRGLSDITMTFKSADILNTMAGDITVSSKIHDDPINLESRLLYEQPLIHIENLKGSAPALSLTGGGMLSMQTGLFDGKLSLTADDLARYAKLADIPLSGAMVLNAVLKPGDAGEQSADISAKMEKIAFDTIKLKELSAIAAINSLANPWPRSAKLEASMLEMPDADIVVDHLNATVAQAGDDQYKLSLDGQGQKPVSLSFDGSALLTNITNPVPSAKDIALSIKRGQSSVNISGLFTPDLIDLKLTSSGLNASDIPADIPTQFDPVKIGLDATMTGTPSQPRTIIKTALHDIGITARERASVQIETQHDGTQLTNNLTGTGTGVRMLKGSLSFPMALSLVPFHFTLDQHQPVSGGISADIDLSMISPLFLPPTQKISGTLAADGSVTGMLAALAPFASIRISEAAFDDDEQGVSIANLSAQANVTKDQLTLTSLTATDGKNGTLNGNGTLSFGNGATNISLRIKDFHAPQGNLANGRIGADLALNGSNQGLRLAGNADIQEMNIIIPERFSSRIPQLNIVKDGEDTTPSFLDRLSLDVIIDAHNQVFVRGWGLDAEFGGKIAVSGTAANPQLDGQLSSRRGRYEEFGKRFTLERANLRFQGAVPPSPYLDILATTPAGDVTGAVTFSGPAHSPSIGFSSTPALPEDEVLSRILFGRDSTKISPLQAVQLAQTIRRFSGQGGGSDLDPLGLLRSATGLDDISVDTDESGAANVDVGKYLTDDVYLELSKGKGEDSGAATIQIEVTPSVNIESRIGQDAQGGGGIFWKHDY